MKSVVRENNRQIVLPSQGGSTPPICSDSALALASWILREIVRDVSADLVSPARRRCKLRLNKFRSCSPGHYFPGDRAAGFIDDSSQVDWKAGRTREQVLASRVSFHVSASQISDQWSAAPVRSCWCIEGRANRDLSFSEFPITRGLHCALGIRITVAV